VDGDTLSIADFTIAGETGPFVLDTPYSIDGVGVITIAADGSYAFDPAADYDGPVPAITYTVSDGNGGTDTSTLQLVMIPVNDAPVSDGLILSTVQDAPVSGIVPATDVDGDTLTFSGPVEAPANGTAFVRADGSVTYVPRFGFSGADSFVVSIDDGNGGITTATVLIDVKQTTAAIVDPETSLTQIPQEQLRSGEPLVIDGIILDTANDIQQLGGQSIHQSLQGIVLETVNQITPLEGMKGLGTDALARGEPIHRTVDLERLARQAASAFPGTRDFWDVGSLTSFSLRMDVSGLGGLAASSAGQQIVVDTMFRENMLFVEITNTLGVASGASVTDYTILRSDGRPLPQWVNTADRGLLLATVPADRGGLDLKIMAHLSDGTTITRLVEIQLSNGEIQELERMAQRNVPLFEEQLRSAN
jgi:hypothetical protein